MAKTRSSLDKEQREMLLRIEALEKQLRSIKGSITKINNKLKDG